MRTLYRPLTIAVLLLVTAGTVVAEPNDDATTIRGFFEAFNAHSPEKMAALVTEDFEVVGRGNQHPYLVVLKGVHVGHTFRVTGASMVMGRDEGVDIANLLMEGILDKTGRIPLGGVDVCFESVRCGAESE